MLLQNHRDNRPAIYRRKLSTKAAKEECPMRMVYTMRILSAIEDRLHPLHLYCRLVDIGLDKKDSRLFGIYYENLIYRRLISRAWAVIGFLRQLEEEQTPVASDNFQFLVILVIPMPLFSLCSLWALGEPFATPNFFHSKRIDEDKCNSFPLSRSPPNRGGLGKGKWNTPVIQLKGSLSHEK